jgi:hypothetical protein
MPYRGLRDGIVQVARHAAALLLHRHIGSTVGPFEEAAVLLS